MQWLIEMRDPDMQISRIRLSDKASRLHPRHVLPKRSQADEPEVVIALLTNPKLPEATRVISDAQEAARTLGRQLLVLNASAPSQIDSAFATLRQSCLAAATAASTAALVRRRECNVS